VKKVLQQIDEDELNRNRDWLLNWQKNQWSRKAKGLRLHLGSGHILLPNYTNVDLYTPEADVHEDIRHLSFELNSAVEIISQHIIEHLPVREVWKTLNHWYSILAPGGTLEIGAPDCEICFQSFLEAPERAKWNRYLWTIFGAQTEADDFLAKNEWSPRDNLELNQGQIHQSGWTLGYFTRMLEDIGFKMLNSFWYDGMGTPSFFIFAQKPLISEPSKTILENDVAIGVFTHRTTYLPQLWASCQKHIPNIPFITRINRGPINVGMSLLRDDFIKSSKRYHIYLDDDIVFLNPDIVRNALESLVANKWAGVSVYSTFEKSALTELYNSNKPELITRNHKWLTGYFICVDSQKVGNILPDLNLPDPNTACDTSFSVAMRAIGYDLGISKDYVYHTKKQVQSNPEVIQKTNEYLTNKYGDFYFQWAIYDNNIIDEGWRI